MATMTIAQALASNATGITIADTPANIGAALSNAALVARVSQFTMNANGAAWASLAAQLAGLGSKFSVNGYRLVVRDTVAFLEDPANAAGLAIGTSIAIYDTAANLLAIVGSPLAARAGSVLMSTSASLSLAQLILLESEPAFSVAPGQSITLADSAANLLALNAVENRPAIRGYSVTVDSTVDIASASNLFALAHFSIGAGATLTIGGNLATMTDPANASTLAAFAALHGVVVNVADTVSNLLGHAAALATLAQAIPGLTTGVADFETLNAAQLNATAVLPHFAPAPGGLQLVDTVANLIALTPSVAALATLVYLAQDATVTLPELDALIALPNFNPGGRMLAVADSLAHLGGLTPLELSVATGIVVHDTVANLLAAHGMPGGTTGVVALLDGTTYNVQQAEALLALTGSLTLQANGGANALLISDTTANLTGASTALGQLESDGPVTITSTDGGTVPGSVIGAAVAASLVTSPAGILVSDAGAALSAFAAQIFGRGFASVTVTSGVFAGTEAQLLDPTLHFSGQAPGGSANANIVLLSAAVPVSAQLIGNTTASVAQLTALSILPNFSVAPGATLEIDDTITALAASAGLVRTFATSVQFTDSETITAATAAALASIRAVVGAGAFGSGGHFIVVSDDAANIANPGNAAGIALADSVSLSVPSIVSANQTLNLLFMAAPFSVNGQSLTITDTAASLSSLAGSASTLNGWGAQVLLSADATLSVSDTQALLGFNGFAVGTHHITLSDSASNLLAPGAARAEAVASTVLLAQSATVTVAGASALLALPGFSANGQTVTIADTPARLATMTPAALVLGTTETIVPSTIGTASDFTLSALQIAALRAMPHLSLGGFGGTIAVSDTASALATLSSAFATAPTGSLLRHVVPTLSADATVSAVTANALANLPGFGLGGHVLAVRDTPADLVSGGVTAGLAIASTVGLDAPATVSVSMATALAALPGFAANPNALTIADTPVALLSLAPGVAALAAHEQIVPYTILNDAGFVLSAAQLQTLAATPNLIFLGPIAVSDAAPNLILLEAVFAAALPGSALLAARGASLAALSADATVSVLGLQSLTELPGFSLGGHSLIVADTPAALTAAPFPALGIATGVTLAAGSWTVSAGAAAALVALPHFSAGPGFSVSDNVADLLAPGNAGGLAAAASVTIDGDVTVNASQAMALHAIAGFTTGTHHLIISNGAGGLAGLDSGTAGMATAIQLSGSGLVTVGQLAAIAALPHFNLNGNSLSVADTAAHLLTLASGLSLVTSTTLTAPATVTADQAEVLSALPLFSSAAGLTVADTAGDLLRLVGGALPADWSGELAASAVVLTADATVTAAQAGILAQLGTRFSTGGHVLTIADAPAALATASGLGSIAGQIGNYTLAFNAGPWTVSAATATALDSLPHFNAGPGMIVSDAVGNLLAPANAAGLTDASSVTLASDVVVSAWQAEALHAIAGFATGLFGLTISNGVRGLANLDSGTAAMASAIQLSGSGVASAAQLEALQALPNFSLNGNVLTVSDTASNLLGVLGGSTALASSFVLQANAGLTAAQAEALTQLPGFSVGTSQISVSDSVADLLLVSGSGPLPDDWAGELVATTIALTGNATVTAAQAEELSALGGRLVLGGYTLTVSDTAANLLNAADAAGLALASSVTLSGPESGLTAAAATALAGLAHFGEGGNDVTVSDSAANLQFAGYAAGIALADHVQLNAATTLSVAAAETLVGLANFQVDNTAPLSIADSLPHLLQLRGVTLSHNDTVFQTTPIGLSEDAVATVAQLAFLDALVLHGPFSLNGYSLTVEDSGRHLASMLPFGIATPTAYVMIGDATLSAAGANALAMLGADLGDNTITVSDTPAALMDPTNTAGIALAGALTLSGNATATAADATSLFANPLFSTGGHRLTIQDSAAALLSLSADVDIDATTLALAGSETVSVATLLGLTEFGIKFSLNGNTLTVADTASNLLTLNNLETNLAAGEVLNAIATVSAAAAETLARLPNFMLGSGVTLTIVDSVAALTALSGAAQAIATQEQLTPGANVTLTVAQAQGLTALNNFSNTGATIVVNDTIANLGAFGWQSIAASYDVTDSIANLVAHASDSLVLGAAAVVLLGDSVTDTTTIDTLASIPHFTRGTATLVVADSPDAIAAHATEILAVASAARVIASTAIGAAQTEQLVALSNAGELTFAGANHLVVADSFANLSDPANAGGVALATVIDVTDTAANLVAATTYNWGSVTPFYILTASDDVTGAEASVLASLGGHYSNGGFVLTMADTAAAVVANSAALTSLGIEAAVTDTIADIGANAGGLLASGLHLASVVQTDIGPVSADTAAGLHALAAVLAGAPIAVSDSASAVVADSANLLALGAHLGSISLTDVSPVPVAVATGLVPLLGSLAGGTLIDVSDTGANVAAQAIGLASLGADLGTVTLSDGTATGAAVAAALLPVQAYLGFGIMLSVSDTAAAIVTASSGLAAMEADSRIASIAAPNETVAHALTFGAALSALSATLTVLDTAAHVNAALDALEGIGATVTSFGLSDGSTPTLDVTVAQLAGDASVLASIASPHHIVVSDTAAHIEADLIGGGSIILGASPSVTGIVATDAGTVTLTEAQVLAAGVDDGPGSAMAMFSGGTLVVTGVAAADASLIAGLGVPPAGMSISDTAAHIQADLASGSSGLVAERALITGIAVTDSGTISLTEAQATAAHVDDGAGSVFAKLTGGDLIVTGVTVAQIDTVAALPVAPVAIEVSDTAADIQADLTGGGSHILAHLSAISDIAVNDAGTISLTVVQIEAAGVDDGAASVLAKMTGETVAVTDATVGDLPTLAALWIVPNAIAVTDTASNIQNDLALGGASDLLASIGRISGIAVSPAGAIALTEAQVLHIGVDDGAGSALSLMTGETLVVTDVAVGDIGTVLGLGVAPASIAVTDTAAHVQSDLASGTSSLAAHIGDITSIIVSDAGTVTLTASQIEAAGVDDGAGSVLVKLSGGSVDVAGAAIADIGTLVSLGVVPASIAISDSAANLDADLTSGSSAVLASIGLIGSISLNDLTVVPLSFTLARLTAADAAIALIDTPYALAIADTASNIQADLASGSSALLAHRAPTSSIDVSDGGTVRLTQAQVLAAHVDDGAGSVFALLSGGDLIVTGVDTADIGTVLGLGFAPTSIAVSDTAAHMQADLVSGSSAILSNLGAISGLAISDGGTIHLTDAQILTAGVDDGAGSALSKLAGGSVVATDVPVADIGTILALGVPPTSIAVSDTAANIEADLAGGGSVLVTNLAALSSIAVNDAGTITLTQTQLLAAHVDDGPGSVLALTSGGTLTVTHVLAADIRTIGALAVVPDTFAISDTAAHIQADLTSGASAILSYLGAIASIAVSPAGTITLTETEVLGASVDDWAGSALAKMTGLTLHVTDVPVSDIGTILGLGVPPASIAISDTAADIQADLTGGSSVILANLSSIGGITVTDAGTIGLTVAQAGAAHIDDGAGSVFALLTGGTLTITDATVADLNALAALGVPPTAIEVSDTAASIQADLASGSSAVVAHRAMIDTITVSDAGTISLTETQVRAAHVDDGAGSVLAKTTGGTLAVTHVLAADVGIVAALDVPPATIAVSDTAAHIQTDLALGAASHLLANIGLVAGIAVSPAGTIALTEDQVLFANVDDGAGSALALMTGQTLTVTNVLTADIGTIAALGVPPDHILVADTAARIEADLTSGSSNILANLASIGGIAVVPNGTIELTDAQILAAGVDDGMGSALALMTGATLTVFGVPVADVATIMGLGVAPAHIGIVDSAANIVADLTGGSSVIAANSAAIAAVIPTDVSLDVSDATVLYNALLGVAPIDESGLTITGTAADLLTAESGLPAMLAAAAAVTMDDDPTGLTAAQATRLSDVLRGQLAISQTLQVVDSPANLLAPGNAAGIALATDVELSAGILSSAAYVTSLAHLHAFNAAGQTIVIQDTVAHLLDPANAAGLAVATQIQPPSDVTVTANELTALASIATFVTGGHAITVADNAASIVALSQGALGFAALAMVTDTAAHVSANLNNLQSGLADHGHAVSIVLTDGVTNTIAITMTAVTYMADQSVVDAIATNGVVRVLGTATQLAFLAGTLAADPVVGHVGVTDTANNILSNLTALTTMGAKFDSATITDATLSATLVSSLLTIPNLNAGSVTISDTGAQIAAAIQSSGASGLAFLNSHTVQLSGDSVVTASQALSLESLSGLRKNGHTLSAWDTASHLIDSIDGYLAAVSAGAIDGVYLKTVGGTATVSASTAAALFSIPLFNKNNPNGSTNVLTVQDTAAHLESAFAALNAHKAAVDGIVISASVTVTDAVFGDLLTLGATTALGVNVTVRDTAANIVAHAPTQLSGSPSFAPATWALSGSATVTVAGAAFLGGLGGFSPGAFTLTLGADGSANVADANNLGNLGATLHLGGHHVHVAGSVATVSGLSGPAKAVVTPDIVDTFAHVATLTIGSGLLGGTITVTDSETPTVAQAAAFLGILLAGGNGGIPSANVTFGGHTEAITDTLANIQTLTGSAGWTSNASVHADFTLVVADTVAHLIDPANTAALEAMAGTTLSGNQTVTAASAESLFNIESTIAFTLGSHTVTIQDTAANILNYANADGESLAAAWQLSANDTVTAVDAETLLTASKFGVNGHTLTIGDSSDNLLDGVLAGDIAGFSGAAHVRVELSGPETLDAQTAAALVALPGFTNNGDLSIQDSSDYLLNPANHTAEADATSVTLVGDETVSVATATALAAVPNFVLGSNHLVLASNDFANAAALSAIGGFDTGFDAGGHTLTMTQDALALTPDAYNALQSDNVVLNGHALSALATGLIVTSGAGTVQVTGNGIDGATLNVYASDGTLLSQTLGTPASFAAMASETDIGNGIVVTETVGASAGTSESAPIIALEETVITSAVTAASAAFAGSGSVQVGVGEYLNVYTTANAPASPAHPDLVYDATAHTLSLDIAGHSPLVLVTLGATTHPAALDPSEIIVQHFT